MKTKRTSSEKISLASPFQALKQKKVLTHVMHRIKNLSRGNFLWTQITTIILDLLRSRSSAGRSFTEAAFQIDGKFRGYHSICYSDNSVVAIVEGRVNGNRLIAAFRVGGRGIQNGATIDSNHVVSPHGKGNAITKLLSDALKKENAGETGVCCIKNGGSRSVCPCRAAIARVSCTGWPHS